MHNPTLSLTVFDNRQLIALGNIVSHNIESGELDSVGFLAAVELFDMICTLLESRGVIVSDHIVCPETL
jgi:hypothetical protein